MSVCQQQHIYIYSWSLKTDEAGSRNWEILNLKIKQIIQSVVLWEKDLENMKGWLKENRNRMMISANAVQ